MLTSRGLWRDFEWRLASFSRGKSMRKHPWSGKHSPQSRRRAPPETPRRTGFKPLPSLNDRRNYERYIALAQAAAVNGNAIEAENYYQHAEHYYRSMFANSGERSGRSRFHELLI